MSPGRTKHVCNLRWTSILLKLEKSLKSFQVEIIIAILSFLQRGLEPAEQIAPGGAASTGGARAWRAGGGQSTAAGHRRGPGAVPWFVEEAHQPGAVSGKSFLSFSLLFSLIRSSTPISAEETPLPKTISDECFMHQYSGIYASAWATLFMPPSFFLDI